MIAITTMIVMTGMALMVVMTMMTNMMTKLMTKLVKKVITKNHGQDDGNEDNDDNEDDDDDELGASVCTCVNRCRRKYHLLSLLLAPRRPPVLEFNFN